MTSITIITLVLIGICCFLAVKYHNADKKAALSEKSMLYTAPVSLDNALEMLKSKGYSIVDVDTETKHIAFEINGNKLILDIERNPITFLYLGFGIEEHIDRECLTRAAIQTTNDIICVKISIEENCYSFLITSCECCIGNLSTSLERYLDIIDDASSKLHDYYHQYFDEKNDDVQKVDDNFSDNRQYVTIDNNKAPMLS